MATVVKPALDVLAESKPGLRFHRFTFLATEEPK